MSDIGLDDVMGAIIALDKKMDAGFKEMREGFEQAASERQAIRDVVDNDLAGQGQVMQLEGKLTEVQKTLRQHGKKIDTLMKERA